MLRLVAALAVLAMLSGCTSDRHFAADMLWPFGNPNAPPPASETAERVLGQTPDVIPIVPQAGTVWPGAVQPMPTLSEIQKDANLPLGQDYTPSLPSPYPPGQGPDQNIPTSGDLTGPLLVAPPGAVPQAVPGDAR